MDECGAIKHIKNDFQRHGVVRIFQRRERTTITLLCAPSVKWPIPLLFCCVTAGFYSHDLCHERHDTSHKFFANPN